MLIGSVLILISLVDACLGFWFLYKYKNNQPTFWYGLFSIAASVYVGANGLGYNQNIISSQLAEHLAWSGGIMTAIFILPFSLSFPLPLKNKRILAHLSVWPLVIIIPLILFTDLFIKDNGTIHFGEGYRTLIGDYFWALIIFFIVYWVWSICNLIKSYYKSDGSHKRQIKLILIGIFISLIISAVFDIFIPIKYVTKFGYIGSLFTSVWLVFTGYILLKK